MNRPCFALLMLLVALAGPLLAAGAAQSRECPSRVCTPPTSSIHPADEFGLEPYPGCYDDFGLDDLDMSQVEDWRDFVQEEPQSDEVAEEQVDLYQQAEDLFNMLYDIAHEALLAMPPVVQEVDASDYSQESPNAPANEPYARPEAEFEEAGAAEAEYSDLEAYEGEFSGYGASEDLGEGFGNEDEFEPLVDPNPVMEIREPTWLEIGSQWGRDVAAALGSDEIMELVADVRADVEQFAADYPLASWWEAADLAWDRIEEQNRTSAPNLATIEALSDGFRLPDDDCGWDCRYDWRALPSRKIEAAASPAAELPVAELNRQAMLSVARSLRTLAGQLEAASTWVAELGGIDVAEIESDHTAR